MRMWRIFIKTLTLPHLETSCNRDTRDRAHYLEVVFRVKLFSACGIALYLERIIRRSSDGGETGLRH